MSDIASDLQDEYEWYKTHNLAPDVCTLIERVSAAEQRVKMFQDALSQVTAQRDEKIERLTAECKSEDGITIGLLDAAITCAVVAANRMRQLDEDEFPDGIKEACADLFQNIDLRFLISFGGNRTYGPAVAIPPVLELIERVSTAEAENAALRAKCEWLSAQVSDEEWLALCSGDHVQMADIQRHELDALIAARAAEPETKAK